MKRRIEKKKSKKEMKETEMKMEWYEECIKSEIQKKRMRKEE